MVNLTTRNDNKINTCCNGHSSLASRQSTRTSPLEKILDNVLFNS